jgi:hypothetical protein
VSELNEAPISPREAAAFLAGQQSRDDDQPLPISDGTNYFGHEGVERGQGFQPMVSKHPVGGEDAAIDSAELGQKILEKEAQVAEPIERAYYRDGDATAPRTPANETVSAEQASVDITRARQQDAAELERLESEPLAQEIDRLRGYDPTQQQQAQPAVQQQEAPPVPVEQTPQGDFDLAAEFQKNPRLLNAVQEYTAQAQRQADAMAQYYTQAVQQNAEAAAASIVSQWPELRGLNSQEQFRTAIQTVAATNPQRAQAMVQHIEQTRAVINEQQRAAAAH